MRLVYIFSIITMFLLSCGSNAEFESKIQELEKENSELERENSELESSVRELESNLKSCSESLEAFSEAKERGAQLIGKWKTPTIYGGGELIIENINGKYFKTETFMDNSVSKKEMNYKKEGNRMIFREKGRNTSDHWVVKSDGGLEVRDNEGVIYSVK